MANGVKLDATFVAEQIMRLAAIFNRAKTQGAIDSRVVATWREALGGLDRDAVEGAIGAIIRADEHFPKPARVIEMSRKWMDRNRAEVAGPASDRRVCAAHGDRYEIVRRYRVATHSLLGNACAFTLTADGAAVLLEVHERELCRKCAPPCYTPELSRTELCVLIKDLTQYDQGRLAQQTRGRAVVRAGAPPWAKAGRMAAPSPAGTLAESVAERAAETGHLEAEKHRQREAIA
jgi:hypothetical protein